MTGAVAHAWFAGLGLGLVAVRMGFRIRARRHGGATELRESQGGLTWKYVALAIYIAVLVAYSFQREWFAAFQIPAPDWVAWAGLATTITGLALNVWVHWALDVNFSALLHLRDEHSLVTTGPYRWVRHPMYTALFVFLAGLTLLTRNLIPGVAPAVGLAVLVALRVPREEAMLAERFGEAWEEYCRRTGRFVPRLWYAA